MSSLAGLGYGAGERVCAHVCVSVCMSVACESHCSWYPPTPTGPSILAWPSISRSLRGDVQAGRAPCWRERTVTLLREGGLSGKKEQAGAVLCQQGDQQALETGL